MILQPVCSQALFQHQLAYGPFFTTGSPLIAELKRQGYKRIAGAITSYTFQPRLKTYRAHKPGTKTGLFNSKKAIAISGGFFYTVLAVGEDEFALRRVLKASILPASSL